MQKLQFEVTIQFRNAYRKIPFLLQARYPAVLQHIV